jgi:hypothetical protein
VDAGNADRADDGQPLTGGFTPLDESVSPIVGADVMTPIWRPILANRSSFPGLIRESIETKRRAKARRFSFNNLKHCRHRN